MKQCPQCEKIFTDDEFRCPHCMNRLVQYPPNNGMPSNFDSKKCPRCNKIFPIEYRHCPECGIFLIDFNKAQAEAKERERRANEVVHCPKCGSTQITAVQRKWSFMAGFATNKVDRFCLNCKHKW